MNDDGKAARERERAAEQRAKELARYQARKMLREQGK